MGKVRGQARYIGRGTAFPALVTPLVVGLTLAIIYLLYEGRRPGTTCWWPWRRSPKLRPWMLETTLSKRRNRPARGSPSRLLAKLLRFALGCKPGVEWLSTNDRPDESLVEFRYVSWPEYGNLAEALAEKVRSGGKKFDLVVGIARGGMPVAMVVSDRLGVKVDFINVKSYDGIGRRNTPRILSTVTEDIEGESVLVVDDLVDQGDTIKTLKQYLNERRPKLLETAVLFKKPWSTIDPDYYLEVVDRWIVFPFELFEVNRLRVAGGETKESKR